MDKRYRTYTQEFKLEALELLQHSGKSAAQLERELGITKGLLLKWRDRYQVRREQGEVSLARDFEQSVIELIQTFAIKER
jgi:transposase-like protein